MKDKMLIRQVSDLHLEFFYDLFNNGHQYAFQKFKEIIPPLPSDKKTVLIVAGDLASVKQVSRIVTFLEFAVPRFKHVIYVLGNHEHYHSDLLETQNIIEEAISHSQKIDKSKLTIAGNIPVLVTVGKVNFICATLWTNYYNQSEAAMSVANFALNDHRFIRVGNLTVKPIQLLNLFDNTINAFNIILSNLSNENKNVFVTHHMPSLQAVDPVYMQSYQSRQITSAFASDLDAFIIKHQPEFWFFGHTHSPVNMNIGNTQLICNPLGYPKENNLGYGKFNPIKTYTI